MVTRFPRALIPFLSPLCAARASTELEKLDVGFVAWPWPSIKPSALLWLLNEVIVNQRKTIVEFGAGISTLYLARIAEEQGLDLYSFEHDAGWRDLVVRELESRGWASRVTLTHAPLSADEVGVSWYDRKTVADRLESLKVDLAIVDGPIGGGALGPMARAPALDSLKPHLNDRFALALDDIHRPGEQKIAKAWSADIGAEFITPITGSGLAMATVGEANLSFP